MSSRYFPFLLGTGSFELRADGSIHEWTVENQSPAGSAKLNYVALDLAVFGVRVQTETSSIAKLLRTHPPKGYPGKGRAREFANCTNPFRILVSLRPVISFKLTQFLNIRNTRYFY